MIKKIIGYVLCSCLLMHLSAAQAALDSATVNKQKPLKIQRITPQGEDVPAGRQIVFQFNQPVVPVGKMERDVKDIHIDIVPTLECQWRWLNTSALACELGDETALKKATRYHVWVKPDFMTGAEQALSLPVKWDFITERPKVEYTDFKTWTAPSVPHIRVIFTQKVKQKSVEKHVYFKNPNGQRVAIRAVYPDDDDDSDEGKKDVQPTVASSWTVSPVQALSENSPIHLVVESGIQSAEGTEKAREDRIITEFHTFPKFEFLGIGCQDLKSTRVMIPPKKQGSTEWTQARCNPLGEVFLDFSAPVSRDVVKKHLKITPDLAGGKKDFDPWAEEGGSGYSQLNQAYEGGKTYSVWLPGILKAYHVYDLKSLAKQGLTDEFGRPLSSPIDAQFATDHRNPSHMFEHGISVLEKNVDSELPLYVTNLDEMTFNYQLFTPQGWTEEKSKAVSIPQWKDIAVKIPLGIRELIPAESGIIQGYFTSQPDVNNEDAKSYNRFFSQVTPFHIQTKIGHFNTLIWVTDFATGKPVKDVSVSIYSDSLSDFTGKTILTQGKTNAEGIALLAGTEKIDPELAHIDSYDNYSPRLFVYCQKGGDSALLPLNYDFRVGVYTVTNYDLYESMLKKHGHIHAWGTTAQGIYKVGDKIQYKIFVRDQNNRKFVPAPKTGYSLKIIDPMGKEVKEIKNVTLSEFGGFSGEYTIPKNAAVGWYDFELKAEFVENTWYPMRVLVSDFTPSPFRVQTVVNGALFKQGDSVKVDTLATLHAGGPYTKAKTRITATLAQEYFEPKNPHTKGFQFDVYNENAYDDTVHQSESEVNDKGELQTTFVLGESAVLYGKLTVESAVQDDRGKNVANATSAHYVGRDRFVGLKETSWLLTAKKPSEVKVLVVDGYGNLATGVDVNVSIERRESKAAQVKGSGNAYITRYSHEWVKTDKCQLVSTFTPSVCSFTPKQAGTYQIVATIKDTKGRDHKTTLNQWATGSDYVMWESSSDNALEIEPEEEEYKVGETARYLVKNPYPGATALVTVERFGVMKSWVETFKSSIQLIEIPIEKDYIPGFFVSATIVSPRMDKPIDADSVDLGKPAFRMGYVKTMVNDPYKQLIVKAQSDKPVYKPKSEVTVDFQVKFREQELGVREQGIGIGEQELVKQGGESKDSLTPIPYSPIPEKSEQESVKQVESKDSPIISLYSPIPEKVEIAVAVLDESVFDLLSQGRDYFDPYKGFYSLDDLDMANFALLMRLVGRQKFEKKGANAGGDGGIGLSMRSLFKYVSYWNPSLKTDAEGKAQIKFTVPDNLTGWRVLAMAVTPSDRMGLGDMNFKVNQPIELRPVLPNQVTEGDNFKAGFSVMNRTDKIKDLSVVIEAKGEGITSSELTVATSQSGQLTMTKTVTAKPYERYTVWLPINTAKAGDIQLNVTATDATDSDGLTQKLTVRKRRSLETAATYGTTTAEQVLESIAFPTDIYPDVGNLTVTASPTVIGGAEGAFEYMRDYPYVCWEQKLSKGTMASHYQNLHDYLPESVVWTESKELPEKTLSLAAEYQASNGGMSFYIAEDKYVSPYLSAYTALAFNWLRESGYDVPSKVENKLHEYLFSFLRRDVMPDFYSKGMASTVRAVALAALAKHGKIAIADIKRYKPHIPNMDLFGKAHYLMAALQVPNTEAIRTEVLTDILAHANQTSGKVSFNEDLDSGYKHLLSSSLRTECAILSVLTAYDEKMGEKDDTVSDMPFKLVRNITQMRKSGGYWENTQENMFCMNALTEFARVYEKESPNMRVKTWMDSEMLGEGELKNVKDSALSFKHPLTAADVGKKATVKVEREGQGRVYYSLRMAYATKIEKATAINSGIEISREYHVERDGQWVLLKNPMEMKSGELVRVDLYLSLPASRYFVVVDDPIPGGLEPVNRDLATASKVDADKAESDYAGGSYWYRFNDWQDYGISFWSFYHRELRHHAAIFYSDYLSAGNYHLSYVAQAIAQGKFSVLPTHAEEMYDPEVYGKGLPAILQISE